MTCIKFASWNVNGIRACHKKGFLSWLKNCACDVVLLQEIRAQLEQIPKEITSFSDYHGAWLPARLKKGYAGTAILSKEKPLKVLEGIGREEFDKEGRILIAEYSNFYALSAYFPNSQDGGKRLDYKILYCEAMHEYLEKLRKRGKPVVLGGDFNIAHQPIDLARPKDNESSPGYLPEERAWMGSFLDNGWLDTFRVLHPETVAYSWWSMRTRARERNIGWRLDYHTVHKSDRSRILQADILDQVMGSDHCPVTLELNVS